MLASMASQIQGHFSVFQVHFRKDVKPKVLIEPIRPIRHIQKHHSGTGHKIGGDTSTLLPNYPSKKTRRSSLKSKTGCQTCKSVTSVAVTSYSRLTVAGYVIKNATRPALPAVNALGLAGNVTTRMYSGHLIVPRSHLLGAPPYPHQNHVHLQLSITLLVAHVPLLPCLPLVSLKQTAIISNIFKPCPITIPPTSLIAPYGSWCSKCLNLSHAYATLLLQLPCCIKSMVI